MVFLKTFPEKYSFIGRKWSVNTSFATDKKLFSINHFLFTKTKAIQFRVRATQHNFFYL